MRTGIDFNTLDQVRLSRSLTTPTLLFHSADDALVPVSSSDAFAQARPDLVTYHRGSGAPHTQLWNIDMKTYDATLKAFLIRQMHL